MHLGARASRPDLILDFLEGNPAETLFLVGDIVDNWHTLARWTADHHRILRHILDLPGSGTRVIYVPGNHDSFFRQYAGRTFTGIEVKREASHVAADGRTYLVIHGDCCDVFSRRAPVLALAGSLIESAAHLVDAAQRQITQRLLHGEWSGIERAIARTNATIRRYDRFEERLSNLASARGFDGVICGHFHQPALHRRHGPVYANCGDWVGCNTAISEGFDGRLRLVAEKQPEATAVVERLNQAEGELTLAM